jgi:putative flippase GtrA
LARLLLLVPPVAKLDAAISPMVGRGRLDRADTLAGLIRYGTMGAMATAVYLVAAILLHLAGLGPNVASAAAIVISVGVSYVAQSRVTFRTGRWDPAQAARFGVIGVIGLTMSRLLVGVLHLAAGLPYWTAVLSVCAVVPVANFAAMNFWVFAERRKATST